MKPEEPIKLKASQYSNWVELYKQQSATPAKRISDLEFAPTVIPCSPYGDSEIADWKSGKPNSPRFSVSSIFFILAAIWCAVYCAEAFFAIKRLHLTHQPFLGGSSLIYVLPFVFYKYFLGKMRKISAIVVDKRAIFFVWSTGRDYVKSHYFELENIRRIVLIPNESDVRKSKILIEEYKLSEKRPFEFELQLLANRDRWKLMKSAIDKSGYPIEIDPLIHEYLKPQERDPAYTDLWLAALGTAPGAESLIPLTPEMVLKEGQYKIKNQIGRGGQGTAYAAINLKENTENNVSPSTVVLKESVLPRHAGMAVMNDAVRRFDQEAQMLKKIDHPDIVKLEDYFVEDSRAYLVLEHVSGKSLKDAVRIDGPMSDQSVVKLATCMCSILQHLHEVVRVVHNDFTPENLILRDDGTVKLIDFTSASKIDGGNTDESIAGKHAYMPPERFRGETDIGSDLYALGGTLYFLLTGEEPEALSECDVRRLNPDAEPLLVKVVASLTVQDKDVRCRSLSEVIDLLKAASKSIAAPTDFQSEKIDLSLHKDETVKVPRLKDL